MPDHAITVSDPVRAVRGVFDNRGTLCDFGFMLTAGPGRRVPRLARANEVRVRAQLGDVGKESEGTVKRGDRERSEWSREGVDERDGTSMSSRSKHDSHFESYETIFNTCYTLEEATIKRIKQRAKVMIGRNLNDVAIAMESGRK